MRNNNLYVRVDRIQSHDVSRRGGEFVRNIEHSPNVWHENGKSSRDVYLTEKAKIEALRNEFRL